ARSGELDPGVDPLTWSEVAQGRDRLQIALAAHPVHSLTREGDRLIERLRPLPRYRRPVPDGDLPAQWLGAAPRPPRPARRRSGDLLGAIALVDRHVILIAPAGVDLTRARDLQVRILVLLHPLSHPARGARDGEDHRERVGRYSHRLIDQAGVEVDVRVELP